MLPPSSDILICSGAKARKGAPGSRALEGDEAPQSIPAPWSLLSVAQAV